MTPLSMLALLPPPLIGFLLLCLLLPGRWNSQLLLKSCLAVGLGFGMSSCLFFVALLLGRPWAVAPLEGVTILVLGGIVFFSQRGLAAAGASMISTTPDRPARGDRLLALLVCGALLASAVTFTLLSQHFPHGGDVDNWDSWGNWNTRARFITGLGGEWHTVFADTQVSKYLQSLDYPLLLPLSVARAWTYGGSEDVLVPAGVAGLFTLSTVGVLGAAIQTLRSRRQGLLAAFALLSVPWFIELGAWQYADVPLACFVLIALVSICLYDHGTKANGGYLRLAGLAAGLAAWTKNEGLVFIVVLLVARGVSVVRSQGWTEFRRELAYLGAGLLPILVVLAIFKVEFAVTNNLIAGQGWRSTSARLVNWERYAQIVTVTARELLRTPLQFLVPMLLLGLYALTVGIEMQKQRLISIGSLGLVLLLMLVCDFFVYVTEPHDLEWQLRVSVLRVLLQLVPAGLLFFFLLVRDPAPTSMELAAPAAA